MLIIHKFTVSNMTQGEDEPGCKRQMTLRRVLSKYLGSERNFKGAYLGSWTWEGATLESKGMFRWRLRPPGQRLRCMQSEPSAEFQGRNNERLIPLLAPQDPLSKRRRHPTVKVRGLVSFHFLTPEDKYLPSSSALLKPNPNWIISVSGGRANT